MGRALRSQLAIWPEPEKPITTGYGLRDYQREANDAIDRALAIKRSTLLVLPTGCGKTVVFAEQARRRGGALILAHRDMLIEQAAQKLRHHTGEAVDVEKADRKAYDARYICASVQSLRGQRLQGFARRHRPGLIVVDEVHHAASKSYRDILDAFPEAKLLGVTATSERGDGIGLWNVLDRADTEHGAAYCYELRAALDDAWLTDFDYRPVFAPIELDKIRAKSTGNLDEAAMDAAISKFSGEIAKALIDSCHGMTLGFTTGVQSAEVTAAALNKLRPGCAVSVHGEMDDRVKQRIVDTWLAGEVDYLLNCAVYIEGADFPKLLNVFDAALTKSRPRHAQKVGRGTRLWPIGIDHLLTKEERRAAIAKSPKPRWRYFHLNGIGDRHDLATPIDLLAGSATPDVRSAAKRILRERGGRVDEALAEAKSRIEDERLRLAAQAARQAAARRARIGDHRNPFAVLNVQAGDGPRTYEPASPGQEKFLLQLGIPVPAGISKFQASRLIGKAKLRRDKGLANYGQLRKLMELGIDAPANMYANTAAAIIREAQEKALAKEGRWMTKMGVMLARPEPGLDG